MTKKARTGAAAAAVPDAEPWRNLPELVRRIGELEGRVAALEKRVPETPEKDRRVRSRRW